MVTSFISMKMGNYSYYYIQKQILPIENEFTSVLFVEFAEIIWNIIDTNTLCVFNIFIKDMWWHLGVIVILNNEEWIMYIFAAEFIDGSQIYL